MYCILFEAPITQYLGLHWVEKYFKMKFFFSHLIVRNDVDNNKYPAKPNVKIKYAGITTILEDNVLVVVEGMRCQAKSKYKVLLSMYKYINMKTFLNTRQICKYISIKTF